MKSLISSTLILTLAITVFYTSAAEARISSGLIQHALDSGDPAAGEQLKAVVEAETFALLESQTRNKLPGRFVPYLEVGYQLVDIDETIVRNYTTTQIAPSYFHSANLRVGTGLPFGFAVEAGISQTVYDDYLSAGFVTASYQLIDLSSEVYLDLVPALSVSGTFMKAFISPAVMSFTGQSSLGFYHRQTLLQLSYIFQYTYSMMTAVNPNLKKQFIRHGSALQMPVYKNFFIRNEIFFATLSANISAGYEF